MTEAVPARRRHVSLGAAAGACVVAAGVAIGMRPLADNSYFTHLATGRIILDTGLVPSHDPYTFTAHGAPWVVQSWLASVLYAATERLAGGAGLRLLSGLLVGILTALIWRLTRPATSVVVRLGLSAICIGVGAGLWGERPYMFGLIGLALVALAAEDGLDPRWLLPAGWIWVNTHGSFPLGIVYLVVVAIGHQLDARTRVVERRALQWLVPGLLLGAISPVGPTLLVFPLHLLGRQELLSHVIEWQAPTFTDVSQRLFLLQVMLAIVALCRRPSYRRGLVLAVFLAAALLGSRNVAVGSILLLPGLAEAAPPLGSLVSSSRSRFADIVAAAGVAAVLLVVAGRLSRPSFELRSYPVDAVAYLSDHDVDLEQVHLAHPDIVGNYLELIYGPGHRVFYDDRFDMFPDDVSRAHLALSQVQPDVAAALSRFDVDLVLWGRSAGGGQRLIHDPAWRTLYGDERWVLLCRRGADIGGDLGTC